MKPARALHLALLMLLGLCPAAFAQGPAYTPETPARGALYRDGQSGRYLLDGSWLYRADQADVGAGQGWWRDLGATDGWTSVGVPNAYNAGDLTTPSMNGYVGWYRKDFVLPTDAFGSHVPNAGRQWIVRFESVNYRASVWLNGHFLGSHAGAFLPWELDLKGLRSNGVNRLIVRVDNRRASSDVPPGPWGGWWNYGGILREVYLRAVQTADVQQVQVTPLLRCASCPATIAAQAQIRNVTGSPQTVRLTGNYAGRPLVFGVARIRPHGTWTAAAEVRIAHPQLWSPSRPFLYRAQLTLSDQRRRVLGGYVTYSGIRKIAVVGGQLTLNGQPLHLRGLALHEQDIATGAALSSGQLAQRMSWIRDLGATVIRAHYPLNPQLLEMADRYGILVWDEIPLWQMDSEELTKPYVVSYIDSVLKQNIVSNENHPSVLLWSIGNELEAPVPPPEASYISTAATLAHQLDPTRPVGMAIEDWPGLPCQGAYGPLDVIGFNEYFGWFDAGGGVTDDRDALSPFLDSYRACYPNKALFVTEFGFDGSRSGPIEERGTYAFQSDSIAFHLGVFATKPWLSGAIYWNLQNFAGWPGWTGGDPLGTPPWVQKGLVDSYGNHKPAYSVVEQIYHATVQMGRRRR
jgi:beta-glucuronidase